MFRVRGREPVCMRARACVNQFKSSADIVNLTRSFQFPTYRSRLFRSLYSLSISSAFDDEEESIVSLFPEVSHFVFLDGTMQNPFSQYLETRFLLFPFFSRFHLMIRNYLGIF